MAFIKRKKATTEVGDCTNVVELPRPLKRMPLGGRGQLGAIKEWLAR